MATICQILCPVARLCGITWPSVPVNRRR
ncbi:hypothetical protein TSAR_009832 [Trichomalopsis sarcophagae]|uniref:Uncharacterized protein n=1 Tax=Trichomalopsis sarcophagae TaxID=543379 RepID=A0A232EK51_9HYME|nr:hypothetical protein TSAR_009832 [Trichomalopsis sarcophagae]